MYFLSDAGNLTDYFSIHPLTGVVTNKKYLSSNISLTTVYMVCTMTNWI